MALPMARYLGNDGLDAVDLVLLALFTITLPWIALGLWNGLIGLAILLLARDPAVHVTPAVGRADLRAPLRSRTAIVMPVFEEEPERVFRHLAAMLGSLEDTGEAHAFELFVLSDTREPATAAQELRLFESLRARQDLPERLHYRRRADNAGHKTGNVWDFLRAQGDRFDFMLVLDADSLMSGEAIVRLARIIEQSPEIGILQQLIVGLPNPSPFPRLFQIGMRHGMRPYALGSAWWQGDCGPFWGHNGIIRIAPFLEHCEMVDLPGNPPLGGRILSHDQVEAVLMRRAGYEVRLLAVEDGSYELNPPTAIEFIKRDLRWCQGNLQYLKLLGVLDTHLIGRIQLFLAILMYVNAPAWLAFTALALGRGAFAPVGAASSMEAWLLLALVLALGMGPKLLGTLAVLLRPASAAAYGGRLRVLLTAALELVFSLLLTPLMLAAQALFMLRMLTGRSLTWGAQLRSNRTVRWPEALMSLRPQLAMGTLALGLASAVPASLASWALLLGTALLAGIPFAVFTSRPEIGALLVRAGLAATPEELAPPPVVEAAGHVLRPPPAIGTTPAPVAGGQL
jgi:membrane glycosyltransferase